MPHPQLDRRALRIKPLAERRSKLHIERDHVAPDAEPPALAPRARAALGETAERIRRARAADRPVMLAFGAHTIKNGLGPVLIRLAEEGWVTHLATNGAGIIHDWEFAFQGRSSEDVRRYVNEGQFGLWEETGRFINLAILVGAWEGLGYGESVGALIANESLQIPSPAELQEAVRAAVAGLSDGSDMSDASDRSDGTRRIDRAAAALDLAGAIARFGLTPGRLAVPHPFKAYSAQAAAFRLGIPFTGHPMFGHDIIYTHPLSHGAAIGRAAERDFLAFAHGVSRIEGGVYLSVGSAVMSPMVFEKSLSMAQNLACQAGRHIDNHFVVVVDLAASTWDWTRDGEPPQDDAAYYLRYCKTFSRMGGAMRYVTADNRDFLLALCRELGSGGPGKPRAA